MGKGNYIQEKIKELKTKSVIRLEFFKLLFWYTLHWHGEYDV